MQIRWTESAAVDLENIRDYIIKDSEYYAAEFLGKIFESIEKLPFFPQIGRIVPELNDGNIRDINNLNLNPWEVI